MIMNDNLNRKVDNEFINNVANSSMLRNMKPFDHIDLSNTVGWFTTIYPIGFEIEPKTPPNNLIRNVKETIRAIPDKGIGYSLLRYLHPEAEVRNKLKDVKWDIVFNYLGQLDNVVNNSKQFGIAAESKGNPIHENFPLLNKLDINSAISQNQFQMTWSYADSDFDTNTIEQLANAYIHNLKNLISFCKDEHNSMVTPSDFGLGKDVSVKELDELFGLDEIQDDGVLNF